MAAILLCTINARYIHANLGLRWIWANLGALEAEAGLLEFTLDDQPADMAEAILVQKPRVLGLGVYIWNAMETQRLVMLLKQLAPELVIVLGGPEVSHLPMRVDFSAADYIIQGEGELSFAALCADIVAGRRPSKRMLSAITPDLGKLKLPYHLYSDSDLAHRLIYVEASRGCPFGCEFCLSSLDKRVRIFDPTTFLAALEALWQRGARTFKFVDRSFNLSQQSTLAILDFFLAKEPPFHAHFEVVPEHFPQAIKEQLCRFPPGTLQLEIGIQTLQPPVATAIGRRMDLDKIQENLHFLATATTAHLHLDLIIGLPGESVEAFGDNLNRLVGLSQGEIQLGILKKLSGTAINRHDQEHGMVYSSLPPYELLQNTLIPFRRMQELKRMARYWDLVYNSGNFRSTAPLLWPDGDVFHGFFAFSCWLYNQTRATWKIALPRLTELLYHYLVEEQDKHPEKVANQLAADILTVKGRVLPELIRVQATRLPDQRHRLERSLIRRQDRHDAGQSN
ncbi:MAG: DUF4080 domain-containing protein [Desulfobulbaceae bacterium]|nr:DUF4080 domain-containing protein [Desulfobulbaceae bacterium]